MMADTVTAADLSTTRAPTWREAVLRGRSVAFIGATADESKPGFAMFRALLGGLVPGAVYGINPKLPTILGEQTYASVLDLPEPPDLAFIATAAEAVPDIVRELGRAGIPVAVVHTSGFAEVGATGDVLQQELVRAAAESGVRVIGPNSLGIFRSATSLNLLSETEDVPTGGVGLVSQSGSVVQIMVDSARRVGMGFSSIIALENQIDVSVDECLDLLAADEETEVIAVYVEGLREGAGPRTLAALRRAVARKPVVVLKGATTEHGLRAAASHTAAIASPSAAFLAMVRQAGAVLAESMDELMPIAETLAKCPPMNGKRVAAVGSGGGLAILGVDELARAGLEAPAFTEATRAAVAAAQPLAFAGSGNPVDMAGGYLEDYRLFSRMNELIVEHEADIHGILGFAFHGSEAEADWTDPDGRRPEDASREIVAFVKRSGVPVVFCSPWADEDTAAIRALREGGVPCFASLRIAAACLRALQDATRGRARAARDHDDYPADPGPAPAPANLPLGLVPEPTALAFLRDSGIAVPRHEFVEDPTDPDELRRASQRIGFPQVLKIVAEGVAHKSDIGGVAVAIANADEAVAAARRMLASLPNAAPGSRLLGVLVVEQLAGHLELRVGFFRDPALGPVADLGAGGTLTELFEDHQSMLAPLTYEEALEMLAKLRLSALFAGYRGRSPADVRPIAALVARLSQLFAAHPELGELEVNPLIIGDAAPAVADVKLTTTKES
ncbi:acetate--CoA ligase family protein [Nocardioides hungaricus]